MEQRCLGRHAVAAQEVVQRNGAGLKLPIARLQNRSNLCYCNAVCHAVYWVGEASTGSSACYGQLQAGLRALRATGPIALPDCLALRELFRDWSNLHCQHDAGEFLQHLYAVARPEAYRWSWSARLTNPLQTVDTGDFGAPLLLTLLTFQGGTLQELVDSWHQQYATHALTQHCGCVYFQICRYADLSRKDMRKILIVPGDVVAVPVFTDDGSACTRLEPFRVVAVISHRGQRVTSGHYQTLLSVPNAEQWTPYLCDDNKPPKVATKKDLEFVHHNAYLVGLLRCP